MKRTLYMILVTLGLLLALFMFGCAARPEEQIKLAQKAMEQAQEQQAAEFAPNEWGTAMQSWKDADNLLNNQKYGEATSMLLRAKTRFEKARDVAKGKRDVVIKETQNIQKTIEIRYKGVKDSMAKAKLSPKAKASVEDSCKEIDQAIEKANAQFSQKEYNQANYTAKTVLRQVYEVEKEIEGAGKKK